MQPDALQPSDAEERQPVLVLQATELALNRRTATVQLVKTRLAEVSHAT